LNLKANLKTRRCLSNEATGPRNHNEKRKSDSIKSTRGRRAKTHLQKLADLIEKGEKKTKETKAGDR